LDTSLALLLLLGASEAISLPLPVDSLLLSCFCLISAKVVEFGLAWEAKGLGGGGCNGLGDTLGMLT